MVVNRFESVKLAFRLINNAKVSIGVNSAEVANRWYVIYYNVKVAIM